MHVFPASIFSSIRFIPKKTLSFSAYARLIHVTLGVEKSTLETFIASIAILQVQQDESKWQGFWYGTGLPF